MTMKYNPQSFSAGGEMSWTPLVAQTGTSYSGQPANKILLSGWAVIGRFLASLTAPIRRQMLYNSTLKDLSALDDRMLKISVSTGAKFAQFHAGSPAGSSFESSGAPGSPLHLSEPGRPAKPAGLGCGSSIFIPGIVLLRSQHHDCDGCWTEK